MEEEKSLMANTAAPGGGAMAPTATAVPQMTMDFESAQGFTLKQKTSEFCRCWCCQPNIDWTLHPYKVQMQADPDLPVIATIKEDAPYCDRCWSWCNPASRETTLSAVMGTVDQEIVPGVAPEGTFLQHSKGHTCGVNTVVACTDQGALRCPCCCWLPYLETKENDQLLGTTRYICDMCPFVPKFLVEDASGAPKYMVRPDTCCAGMCMRCKCMDGKGCGKGARCFRVPFYIRDPNTLEKAPAFDGATGDEAAQITDLWAGFKNECCHKRNMYTIKYPQETTTEMKKTLIGTALLVDLAVFEVEED